jgi:fructokinase|tara:strand:- start:1159 stop:2085 length:927 start_codon:yes stop_codon:yes gene_type:complete
VKSLPCLYAGIEAGGTKFNCVLGRSPTEILERASFPTTRPDETLGAAIQFFEQAQARHGAIASLGVACFGPVDLSLDSPTYGFITDTPKAHWSNTDVVGTLSKALGVPVAFDTDVNGSALGEGSLGAAQGLDDYVYVTIGTGVGAGIVANGQPVKGAMHPEVGHMLLPHDREVDPFPGACPFHGDCVEGLASGPAIEKRWKQKADTLPQDHEAWDIQADYLAALCWNLTVTYSPQRIILGGGVMKQDHLFPRIHQRFQGHINGYPCGGAAKNPQDYIVAPELGGHAGEVGALLMAQAIAPSRTSTAAG